MIFRIEERNLLVEFIVIIKGKSSETLPIKRIKISLTYLIEFPMMLQVLLLIFALTSAFAQNNFQERAIYLG